MPSDASDLLWEHEAAGSNPAIPTRRHGHPGQLRAHVDLDLA